MLKEYTSDLIKGLVDNPEDVVVTEQRGIRTVLINIEVNKNDVGYVIGRNGRIITSVRNLVKAVGARMKKQVVIELYE